MPKTISRWTIAAAAVFAVLVSGFWLWSSSKRPEVASADPGAGAAGACAPGAKAGAAGFDDHVATPDGLRVTVRAPANYDATRAYPLLVVFPPAGFSRAGSEAFYDLTTEATRRGFVVAFSEHLPLSRTAVKRQARVAAAVAERFCVDPGAVVYLGHSDGGTMAEGVPAFARDVGHPPRAIVASAAGVTREDLGGEPCPEISDVLILHNRNDRLFPDFGRRTAIYWGGCAACAPPRLDALEQGCRQFSGCAPGKRVAYCETSEPHGRWPDVTRAALDFLQGRPVKP